MSDFLSLGMVLPANNMGGPQKITAIAALDLASQGHKVTIFLPVLPYYYYNVSLRKRRLSWLRVVRPHVEDWARNRTFAFQELINDSPNGSRVSVKFVLRRASRKQLKGLDHLFFNSVAQVQEYKHLFPQERQVYLLWHPEEHDQGHGKIFKAIRESFRGKVVISSRFTCREIADHISNPILVPAPISTLNWEQRSLIDPDAKRKDLLISWKDNISGRQAAEIVRALTQVRPETTLTVWCPRPGFLAGVQDALPGIEIVEKLSEQQLCDLYLNHSLLLFTSTFEGLGLPPIEGLACGCIPILHPDVGAADMYTEDGTNAIHLTGSEADTARRIASILDSPESLRSMRIAAPQSITSFDPNGYGTRLLQAAEGP